MTSICSRKTLRLAHGPGLTMALLLAACGQPEPPAEENATPAEETSAEMAEASKAPESQAELPPPNPLRNAYFGDLHIHTRNSYDAYLFNVRARPEDAYVYAKGGTISHPSGFDLKMKSGPLDFLAVTDHAEYLGVVQAIDTPGTEYSKVPYEEDLFSDDPKKVISAFGLFVDSLVSGEMRPDLSDMSATRSAWQETIESAERNYQPGIFTTFIGYEFTSAPQTRNMHRNVIYAGSEVPPLPFSEFDSQNPEELWKWLDAHRADGIEALAIPHNPNASDGMMFEYTKWNGQPIDRAYAEMRRRNEPLVEIIQNKGQSETMPMLSPNDEFAGFEVRETYVGSNKPITNFAGSYIRDALKRGLEIERKAGLNPYKLGFVAGSDGHNAASGYAEDNFYGNHGVLDAAPQQRGAVPPAGYDSWDAYYAEGRPAGAATGTGGLTGIWAEENTRASLYAGLRRRETFGTSGPRIRVRFFAGYDLGDVDLATDEGVSAAYDRGVPMGGDLSANPNATPQFAVIAMRDAQSAPLQRIQIIKGWADDEGAAQEKVFDIACADSGEVDAATHRCPDNGATVSLETCAFSQDKGDAQIQGLWTDPEFDPSQSAFYYVRVLENPTCRWSTWDAVRVGAAPNPKRPATIQERAYTSPIWYVPTHVQ